MRIEPLYKNYEKFILPKINCQPHHLQSTIGDNLIEIAGRICYDSFDNPKSRSSEEYHKHINDVGHGSVQEHFNFTVEIGNFTDNLSDDDYAYELEELINRPGIWVEKSEDNTKLRITANIRSVIEWDNSKDSFKTKYNSSPIGNALKFFAKQLCPMACSKIPEPLSHICYDVFNLVYPTSLEEQWISFYISGVSRNLTHELIRHKWRTAVSQRSTRYVDESESDWAWHPLIIKYQEDIDQMLQNHVGANIKDIEEYAGAIYSQITTLIQNKLVESGLDKATARKQSRGAARGFLGTCLSTELVFSASVNQWLRMCLMRCSEHADSEIRVLHNLIWEELEKDFPEITNQYEKIPCNDGIGYGINKRTQDNLD